MGQFSSDVPPTINKRAMSSTIIVREGETIVLGGLVQETESELKTRVPILGSIPLLGSIFSSTTKDKRKSQLMIYVTPRISYGKRSRALSHIQVRKSSTCVRDFSLGACQRRQARRCRLNGLSRLRLCGEAHPESVLTVRGKQCLNGHPSI